MQCKSCISSYVHIIYMCVCANLCVGGEDRDLAQANTHPWRREHVVQTLTCCTRTQLRADSKFSSLDERPKSNHPWCPLSPAFCFAVLRTQKKKKKERKKKLHLFTLYDINRESISLFFNRNKNISISSSFR